MASASRRCSGRPAAARLPRAAATQPTEQPINSARSPATAAVETHRPASFNATSVATPAPRPRSDRPPRDTYRTPPRHGYCAAPISGTAASRWPRERRSGRAPSRPTRTWPVEGSANSQSPHTDPGISQVRRIVISGWRGIRVPSAAMARRARDRAAFALLHLGGQQRLEVTCCDCPSRLAASATRANCAPIARGRQSDDRHARSRRAADGIPRGPRTRTRK